MIQGSLFFKSQGDLERHLNDSYPFLTFEVRIEDEVPSLGQVLAKNENGLVIFAFDGVRSRTGFSLRDANSVENQLKRYDHEVHEDLLSDIRSLIMEGEEEDG